MLYTSTSISYPIQRTDVVCLEGDLAFSYSNEVLDAKLPKILGHVYFPEADYLVWVDGNIFPLLSESELVEKYLQDADLAIPAHPIRGCLYEEIATLQKLDRFKEVYFLLERLKAQEIFYRNQHFPENYGLWECNFILRKNTPEVNNLFNCWWAHITRWQWRDQVSFPYVLHQFIGKINFRTIAMPDIRENPDFRYVKTSSI